MESTESILQNLSRFNGTEIYHPYSFLNKKPEYLLTDGVQYLCNSCNCFWLIDYLISVQTISGINNSTFQSWKLTLLDKQWRIDCTDGNNHRLYSGIIEFSDFPLNGIALWLIDGVILLPSEY